LVLRFYVKNMYKYEVQCTFWDNNYMYNDEVQYEMYCLDKKDMCIVQ